MEINETTTEYLIVFLNLKQRFRFIIEVYFNESSERNFHQLKKESTEIKTTLVDRKQLHIKLSAIHFIRFFKV